MSVMLPLGTSTDVLTRELEVGNKDLAAAEDESSFAAALSQVNDVTQVINLKVAGQFRKNADDLATVIPALGKSVHGLAQKYLSSSSQEQEVLFVFKNVIGRLGDIMQCRETTQAS